MGLLVLLLFKVELQDIKFTILTFCTLSNYMKLVLTSSESFLSCSA